MRENLRNLATAAILHPARFVSLIIIISPTYSASSTAIIALSSGVHKRSGLSLGGSSGFTAVRGVGQPLCSLREFFAVHAFAIPVYHPPRYVSPFFFSSTPHPPVAKGQLFLGHLIQFPATGSRRRLAHKRAQEERRKYDEEKKVK